MTASDDSTALSFLEVAHHEKCTENHDSYDNGTSMIVMTAELPVDGETVNEMYITGSV